jgi:Ca2+-binding EF-hand superfamily protein
LKSSVPGAHATAGEALGTDEDGYLSVDDLKAICRQLGEGKDISFLNLKSFLPFLDQMDCEAIFEAISPKNSGLVKIKSIVNFMLQNSQG